MADQPFNRYLSCYKRLLYFCPKPFYDHFAESMEQTFSDLLRDCAEKDQSLLNCALWLFLDTSAGIIREKVTHMLINRNTLIRLVVITASILLIPLIAMQLSDAISWGIADFVVAATLIFGAGLSYLAFTRTATSVRQRALVGVTVLAALLLIWIQLAVGIV